MKQPRIYTVISLSLLFLLLLVSISPTSSSLTDTPRLSHPRHALLARTLQSHSSAQADVGDVLSDLFDDDADTDDDDEQEAAFYLAHVQCRRCLRDNALFSSPCSPSASSSSSSWHHRTEASDDDRDCCGAQCSLPEYQPLSSMQWCPTALTSDWEGQCVAAVASCPALANGSAPLFQPLLTTAACFGDAPASKLTCELCVLDGYHWVTRQGAVGTGDNYAGDCVGVGAEPVLVGDAVVVEEMDGCPSYVQAQRSPRTVYHLLSFLLLFFLATSALCMCYGVRRCVQWRQARKRGLDERILVVSAPFLGMLGGEGGQEGGGRMTPLLLDGSEGMHGLSVQVAAGGYEDGRYGR